MKVTRSFWLGIGSGLILSAMIALLFSPQQKVSDVKSDVNIQESLPPTEETKQAGPPQPAQSPESKSQEDLPSDPKSYAQIDRDFVIPKGATAERIADLLFAQDFIKDKEAFLARAHQMGIERLFRVGTFKLSLGLTEEEIIHRLLR